MRCKPKTGRRHCTSRKGTCQGTGLCSFGARRLRAETNKRKLARRRVRASSSPRLKGAEAGGDQGKQLSLSSLRSAERPAARTNLAAPSAGRETMIARTRWREQMIKLRGAHARTCARFMVRVRKQSTISAVTSKHSRGFRHSRQISYRVLSPVDQTSDSSNASPQNKSRILHLCVREHRLYTQIYADVLRRCVPVQPGT